MTLSAEKVKVMNFWDSNGIILTDFFKKESKILAKYYHVILKKNTFKLRQCTNCEFVLFPNMKTWLKGEMEKYFKNFYETIFIEGLKGELS